MKVRSTLIRVRNQEKWVWVSASCGVGPAVAETCVSVIGFPHAPGGIALRRRARVAHPTMLAPYVENGKMRPQSSFMLTTVQPRLTASSQAVSSLPTGDDRS